MIILSASGLSLSFAGRTVLSDIDFSVNEGDRLGIIGVNGAGKTTLFRMITGEYTPEAGAVYIARGKTVGLLSQNTAELGLQGTETLLSHMIAAFPELLSLEEEIAGLEDRLARLSAGEQTEIERATAALAECHRRYAAGGGLEYRGRCRAMLLRMGFAESELGLPVCALSGGQNTRLELCRLLCREPDILMLDEPTNHLDIDALLWLEDFLVNYPKTVLLISHDRYFLDRVTTKTLHIEHTRARLYPGNYTKARELREAERLSTEKKYKEQQKEIAKIEANIAFQRRCGQEHNFVTIRAKQKQLDRMEKVTLAPPPPKDIRFSFASEELPSGNDVVRAKDLSFSFGEKPLIEGLDFLIRRGERVLFLGQNGCGKSTLMKLLVGKLLPKSGKIELGANIKPGYYDQENQTLTESNTVFGELRDAYPQKTDWELRSALALFLFGAEDMEKMVSVLSGGERARLTLAKLILTKINLLVLDEPTNHLDIGSREVLEDAIAGFDGTVIAVSHDRYFINRVATRLIELDPAREGGCVDYPLSEDEDAYAQYRRMREERQTAAAQEEKHARETASDGKRQYEQAKREAAERRMAERRRAEAERKIPLLEKELGDLEAELFGSAATDYVRAAEIENRRAEIEEELLSLYELTM